MPLVTGWMITGVAPCQYDGELCELWLRARRDDDVEVPCPVILTAVGYGFGVLVVLASELCSGSPTTNTLVSKVCMLLTEGKTAHSILWKVRVPIRTSGLVR